MIAIVVSALFVFGSANAETASTPKGNEKATLTFDPFREDLSYRQDFCARYQEMAKKGDGFSLKDALSGSKLSVLIEPDDYFRYDNETGIDPEYPGINALVLDYMAEKGNFTWRDSFGLTSWDLYESSNMSTIQEWVEMLVERYDVVSGYWTPSPKRMNAGIDFVDGFYDGTLIMTRINDGAEYKIDWFSFTRPFEPKVWYMIIAVIIFSSICHRLIEQFGGSYDSNVTFRTWAMTNLYLSFINATGNYEYQPKSLGGRIFGVFFALWGLLLTGNYKLHSDPSI